MKTIDLTGKKFERWTALSLTKSVNGDPYWLCKCDCGTIKEVMGSNLRQGKSTSCGCTRGTVEERFWSHVQKTETCWNWTGSLTIQGYGIFRGGNVIAHRFSYELLVGPIPEGLTIDHLCRNRRCVNPAHLEAVTNRENILRGVSPAAINARKTHCKRGHPLAGDNLILTREGFRECRSCIRTNNMIREAKKRRAEQITREST